MSTVETAASTPRSRSRDTFVAPPEDGTDAAATSFLQVHASTRSTRVSSETSRSVDAASLPCGHCSVASGQSASVLVYLLHSGQHALKVSTHEICADVRAALAACHVPDEDLLLVPVYPPSPPLMGCIAASLRAVGNGLVVLVRLGLNVPPRALVVFSDNTASDVLDELGVGDETLHAGNMCWRGSSDGAYPGMTFARPTKDGPLSVRSVATPCRASCHPPIHRFLLLLPACPLNASVAIVLMNVTMQV